MAGNKNKGLINSKYLTHWGVIRTTFFENKLLNNIKAHWFYKQQKNAWNNNCMNRHEQRHKISKNHFDVTFVVRNFLFKKKP